MNESNTGGAFFAGFVLGALVGAAVALLYTPQSGDKTRLLLQEKSIDLKTQVEERSSGLKSQIEERLPASAEKAATEEEQAAETPTEETAE